MVNKQITVHLNKLVIERLKKIDELVNAIDRELNSRDPYFDQGPGVYVLKCHDVYKIGKADDLRTRLLGRKQG